MHYLDKLADLKKQLDAGIITQAEFDTMKARILAQADGTEEEVSTEPERGLFALYFSTLKKAFRIKGRANRTEYFLFTAVNGIITSIISLYLFHLLKTDPLTFITIESSIPYSMAKIILGFFFACASCTLFIRRFHDFNRSGWFAVAPWLGILASIPLMFIAVGFITIIIASIIALIWLLMGMFKSGTPYTNVYGAKPRTKRYIIGANWVLYLTNISLAVYLISQAISFLSPDLLTSNAFKSQFMGNKQAEQFIDELSKIDQNPEYGLTLPESAEPTFAVGSAPRPSTEIPEMSKGLHDRPSLTFEEMNTLGQQEGDELNGYAREEASQETKASEEPATEPTAEASATETPATEPATETPATETPTAAPINQEPADIMQEAEKFFKNEAQGSVEEAKKDLSDVLTAVADENKAQQPVEFATETQDELEKEAQEIEAFLNTSTVDGTSTSETNIELNTSNILAK